MARTFPKHEAISRVTVRMSSQSASLISITVDTTLEVHGWSHLRTGRARQVGGGAGGEAGAEAVFEFESVQRAGGRRPRAVAARALEVSALIHTLKEGRTGGQQCTRRAVVGGALTSIGSVHSMWPWLRPLPL